MKDYFVLRCLVFTVLSYIGYLLFYNIVPNTQAGLNHGSTSGFETSEISKKNIGYMGTFATAQASMSVQSIKNSSGI